jgi:uncharacterized delta-60 repeat protein
VTGVHGPAPDAASAIAVQPNGRIVVAGGSGYGCPGGACDRLVVARYRTNGQLDRSFGKGGIVSPRTGSRAGGGSASEVAYGVVALREERILVGGLLTVDGKTRLFLRRYLADGSPDRIFGIDGEVTTLPLRAARRHG